METCFQWIQNIDGADRQFEHFVANKSGGIAQVGLSRINQSIEPSYFTSLGQWSTFAPVFWVKYWTAASKTCVLHLRMDNKTEMATEITQNSDFSVVFLEQTLPIQGLCSVRMFLMLLIKFGG